MRKAPLWVLVTALAGWGFDFPAMAQTIVPAGDGTATLVMPNGNTFNITGGQLSGDGRNLFHSFQDFGLSAQQIANFIANPQIQNILGRVVGGNPSVINGLLQVSGANANLFLMNPSGIVFGPNAALNVPASFAATTATGISFGAVQFNAFGPNSYSALAGNPQGFVFQGLQPGAIINAGNLSVNPGETISLTGGTVINTGTLSAPGGEITLTAVPGAGLVRISQKGQVLSLEVPLPQDSQGNVLAFQPTDLPALLTGSGLDTGLTVTPNGTVVLAQTGSQLPTQPGTALVSGKINVSSPAGLGGTAQITGSQVGLVGAQVQADGLLEGGTLKVGGDYRGQGNVPTAENTFVSADSRLSANALGEGDGGRITVWADGNTQFQGAISAQGGPQGGNGGFAEVSGKENLAFQGQVNLTAPQGELGTLLLDPENITIVSSSVGLNDSQLPVILFSQDPGADYTISESALEALAGTTNIQLEAANNITINPLLDGVLAFQSGTGTITFTANADNLGGGDFTMGAGDTLSAPGRSLTIQGVNLSVGSIDTSNPQIPGILGTPGGNIALLGTGNLQSNGVLNSGGGSVTLSGANITLPLGSSVLTGDSSQAGAATLTATGATQIEGTIFTYGNSLNITSGSLTTTADAWLDSSNSANPNLPGGPITLNNTGDAQLAGYLFTSGASLTVTGNNINIADTALVFTASLDLNATGGALSLQGTGNVQIGVPSTSGSFGGLVETGGGAVTASGANLTLNIPLDTSNPNPALPGGAVTLGATGTNQINSSVTTGGGNFTASGASIQISASSTLNVFNGTSGVGGGNVTFQSSGDLQLNQSIITNGGSFSASAANLTLPEVNTSTGADGLDGGAITLNASGNIQTGNLLSYTTANRSNGEASRGGDITLSAGGSINTTVGTGVEVAQTSSQTLFVPVVTSGSETGNGGNITLNAGGDITSAFLASGSLANGTAGTISLTSQNGGINATQLVTLDGDSQILGAIVTASNQGQGGNVTLAAPGNIQTGSIITGNIDGVQPVGAVTLTSSNGSINTAIGANISPLSEALLAELGVEAQYLAEASQIAVGLGIITISKNVSGGNVTLNAQGDIATTNIITGSLNGAGGDINLTSATGSIDASSGVLVENVTASFLQSLGASENLARLGAYLSDNQIGGLITLSVYGNGGDINLSAPGGIITNYLVANSYVGQGGNITLNSANGSIQIGGLITSINPLIFNVASDGLTLDDWNAIGSLLSQGTLTTAGAEGGDIALTAGDDIELITANAQGESGAGGDAYFAGGGAVTVRGATETASGATVGINTVGATQGGTVTAAGAELNTNGEINTGGGDIALTGTATNQVNAALDSNGGNVTLNGGAVTTNTPITTNGGTVTTSGANVTTNGSINTAGGDIVLTGTASNQVNAALDSNGGDVTLNGGAVTATSPITTNGGAVTASGTTINTGTITTNTGNVTVNGANVTTNGEINSGGGDIVLTGTASNQVNAALTSGGGDVTLNGGAVTTNTPITTNGGTVTASGAELNANGEINSGGGAVNLTATGTAQAQETITTNGGNVAVTGAAVTAADIDASASSGTGGNITLNSQTNITAGNLNTSGTNGGNVALTAPGDIEAVTVNAQGTTGTGGTVEIRAGENVRVTGTFVDQNGVIASLSTAGGAGGGPITIQAGNVPFVVGNPSLNGTAGAITTGETTISAEDFNFTTQRGDISLILRPPCGDACAEIEDSFNPRYVPPFNAFLPPQNLPVKTLEQTDDILAQIEAQTGKKPALIYVNFVYPQLKAPVFANAQFQQLESARVSEFQTVLTPSLPNAAPTLQIPAQGDYQLELVVITQGADPLRISVPEATQRQILTTANRFQSIISRRQNDYQTYGAQLYQWLLAPLESVFQARGIDSALFFLPNGLRTLPLAALYDEKEQKFAVEKPYSIGTAPSLNLVDYRYRNLNTAPVLAFGATEFSPDQQQTPLPGVGVELSLIQSIKGGQYFLNPEFNLSNVESQRRQNPLPIVHLATHADFLADSPQASYIQLYNQKLELPQWDRLDLNLPATDLLVLSACNSAVGNWAVELGFGGMAVQAGVKTALASLWPVGDIGTVGLMDSFYRNLKEVSIKSEALQAAQRALLRGQYRWVNGRLVGPQGDIEFKDPESQKIQSLDLTHPYFWASFMMIGSPW